MKKKFIIILKNKQKGTLSEKLLNDHINHLKKLTQEKKLYLCGPFKDNDGALQILISENIETARHYIKKDPFIISGYYQHYDIHELIEANADNNWLMSDSQTKGNIKK